MRCDQIRLEAGAATSAGNRRAVNEDCHIITDRYCIVADGMGGHAGGGVASAMATSRIALSLGAAAAIDEPAIHTAVELAHRDVLNRAELDGTDGMGTTIVLAAVAARADGSPAVAVAHVGDSRCYVLQDGALRLVTRDHSLVQELVRSGRCSASEAASHPMANVITRAVGLDRSFSADVTFLDPSGCRLLLCSDGLSNELPIRTIGRILAGILDPQAAADRLVELALSGTARDNITAVVIDVAPTTPT